jgi:hypothetical protein
MNKTEKRLVKKAADELDALLISHNIEYGHTALHGSGGHEYEQKFWEILRQLYFLLE